MENKDTFTTNEMYKMFAIVGLLALLAGLFGYIWINTQAYKLLNRDRAELNSMAAALAQPHNVELEQRKEHLERSVTVGEMDRQVNSRTALAVILLGAGALALGFCNLPSRVKTEAKAADANQLDSQAPHPAPALASESEPVPSVQDLVADPSTSKWLVEALTSALKRDPVDAAIDAEMLQKVLTARMTAIFKESRRAMHNDSPPG